MSGNPADDAEAEPGVATRAFTGLVSGLNALGSLLVLAMVVMINIEAFSRTVLHAPFEGIIEMIELGIVAIVFLQLADATRQGVLTRSDGLINLLMRHRPAIGLPLAVCIDLAAAAFMGLILYGSFPLLIEAWREGHYVGVQHVFTAPKWPIKLIIVVGALVTMIQLLIFAARHWATLRRRAASAAQQS